MLMKAIAADSRHVINGRCDRTALSILTGNPRNAGSHFHPSSGGSPDTTPSSCSRFAISSIFH